MHSRLFVIASGKEIETGNFVVPFEDEIVEAYPDIDYAKKSEDFKRDIEWFKETLGDGVIDKEVMFLIDESDKVIGYRINKESLKNVDLSKIGFRFYEKNHGFFETSELYNVVSNLKDEVYIIDCFDYHF